MASIKNSLRLPLIMLLSVATTSGCGGSEERASAARARFEQASAAGDAAGAAEAIGELREELPRTSESALELARLQLRLGETNQALWFLEEAAARDPDRADLQLALAETALLVGDAARALAATERISPEDSEYAYALRGRSRAQLALGDLEAALATLEQGEKLYPDRLQFRIDRIETLVSEKRFEPALELVVQARERDGIAEAQRAWLERSEASLLQALGRTDEALALLAAATAARPEDAEAWARRVGILIDTGRAEEAYAALTSAVEARPDVGALHALLASAQLARGNLEAAEAAMRARVERAPDLGAVQDLAEFLYRSNRSAEGAAVLAEAIEGGLAAGAVELEYLRVAMLLGAGDSEGAQRQFAEFERRHGGDPRTEYLRARFDLAHGDPAAAAERLKQVLPRLDQPDVQHWLGVALERLGDYAGAEYRYGLAVQRNPDQLSSYPGLIRALERRGAWGQTEQYARVLLRRSPNNGVAFDALTRSMLMRGELQAAEKVLREFSGHYPGVVAPTVALSEVLRTQARPAESLQVLDAAAPRFEGEPEWVAERAIVLGLLGRREEGLALLARSASDRDHASLHRARAFLLLSAGKGSEGLAEVERALLLDPEDPTSLRLSGDYLASRGDFAPAARSYERYLVLRPGDAEISFRLGVARAGSGDAAGAIAAYRQTIALDDDAVSARNNLALTLEQEGRQEEALAVAQAAYARAESNPVVMDTLGTLYLRAGRLERAVALLEKASEAAGQNVESRYHLALAYRESGRPEEARRILEDLDARLDAGHELHRRVADAIASLR